MIDVKLSLVIHIPQQLGMEWSRLAVGALAEGQPISLTNPRHLVTLVSSTMLSMCVMQLAKQKQKMQSRFLTLSMTLRELG